MKKKTFKWNTWTFKTTKFTKAEIIFGHSSMANYITVMLNILEIVMLNILEIANGTYGIMLD